MTTKTFFYGLAATGMMLLGLVASSSMTSVDTHASEYNTPVVADYEMDDVDNGLYNGAAVYPARGFNYFPPVKNPYILTSYGSAVRNSNMYNFNASRDTIFNNNSAFMDPWGAYGYNNVSNGTSDRVQEQRANDSSRANSYLNVVDWR